MTKQTVPRVTAEIFLGKYAGFYPPAFLDKKSIRGDFMRETGFKFGSTRLQPQGCNFAKEKIP